MHGRKKGSSLGYTQAKIQKYVKLKNIVLAKHKVIIEWKGPALDYIYLSGKGVQPEDLRAEWANGCN